MQTSAKSIRSVLFTSEVVFSISEVNLFFSEVDFPISYVFLGVFLGAMKEEDDRGRMPGWML